MSTNSQFVLFLIPHIHNNTHLKHVVPSNKYSITSFRQSIEITISAVSFPPLCRNRKLQLKQSQKCVNFIIENNKWTVRKVATLRT